MKALLGIVPTLHSAALLGENIKFAKKKDKKATDFVGMGMKNIVGTKLIKSEADLIGGL